MISCSIAKSGSTYLNEKSPSEATFRQWKITRKLTFPIFVRTVLKNVIIYENLEHHSNWFRHLGIRQPVRHYTDYIYRTILYTKTFSGLSITVHIAQMKLPRVQTHLWLWFQFSIFIPVNFHKAVILARWIQTWRAIFFPRMPQNGPKFGTASDSFFPLRWVYNSISKDSGTHTLWSHNNKQNTPENRILRHKPNIVSVYLHSSINLFISLHICQIQKK